MKYDKSLRGFGLEKWWTDRQTDRKAVLYSAKSDYKQYIQAVYDHMQQQQSREKKEIHIASWDFKESATNFEEVVVPHGLISLGMRTNHILHLLFKILN